MTDQEINTAIAEIRGWNRTGNSCSGWQAPDGCPDKYPPAYYRDLNAMHEAVMSLPAGIRSKVNFALMESLQPNDPYALDRTINATARQRAEAFLRTLEG